MKGALRRASTGLAILIALSTVGVAVRWGAFVAGGSDSHCYLGSARMWVDGTMLRPVSPGFDAPWHNRVASLAPTGFVPSRAVPGGIAPMCPPGLGVVMAGAEIAVGRRGPFAIVPLCAGVIVWCAFSLARRLAGDVAGLLAAALTAVSPTLLYQAVQPMSDVPAAAGWLAGITLAARATNVRCAAAGVAAGLAILVRPNLAPLIGPLALLVLVAGRDAGWGPRWRRVFLFCAGVLPGVAAVGLLNDLLYGSPLASGYGALSDLFSLSNVPANASRYPRWLVETHTPWPLAALAAPFVLTATAGTRDDASPRALANTSLLVAGLTVALYLPYVVFTDWSYLRFVLVAIVLLIALASAVTARLGSYAGPAGQLVLVVLVAGVVGAVTVREARARHVFEVRDFEARFVDTATWVRDHLPRNSIFLTVWHSGSIRYHGDRPSITWDEVWSKELDPAIESLVRAGRHPYILAEGWEVEAFRKRFGGVSEIGWLDWPPRARIGRDIQVWDPRDRARYFAGVPVASERVWTRAERRRFNR